MSKKNKRKYTIDEKLRQLKEVKGYVIMRKEFNISSLGPDQLKLIFCNPYEEGANKICIEVPLNKSNITAIGDDIFSTSNKVNLIVLGHIISWNSPELVLKVKPIAIY